ncbi:MAG: glycosyltransferase [Paludibacter sp.]|nr:glycosyltransferase [Paludibacter sp.]
MNVINVIGSLNSFFFIYACILFVIYILTAVLSVQELKNYITKNRYVDYKSMLAFQKLPSISIIAPAYNEEKTIIENVKCLLALQYQNFEIIIVNDGSKDNTLSKIIAHFDLIKVNKAYESNLTSAPIRAIYKSTNPAYNHVIVVDKENGGKADALNAGINVAQNDLFMALDVDCIIEPDALLKMVKPFLDDSEHVVIASGGVVRIANSCEVADGKIVKVNYARNFWAKFQVLEYFRAFTMGRMAWSKLNGLLIISGAFGLFDRKRVIKVGGYDKTTVGEDLELVVRLRKYMHEVENKKYRVAFIPDPLCWTEVPESYKILSRQRNRWTRGGIDTILKHKNMFFNPKYGLIGMVSFPYWVFFEWLAPILQFFGILYFVVIILLGMLNHYVFVILLLFVFSFSVMYSLFAVFFEAYTYNKYQGMSYILQAFIFIFLEMLIYQPLNMLFSLSGNYDFFFKKNKKGWGDMTRTGFTNKKGTNSTIKP